MNRQESIYIMKVFVHIYISFFIFYFDILYIYHIYIFVYLFIYHISLYIHMLTTDSYY